MADGLTDTTEPVPSLPERHIVVIGSNAESARRFVFSLVPAVRSTRSIDTHLVGATRQLSSMSFRGSPTSLDEDTGALQVGFAVEGKQRSLVQELAGIDPQEDTETDPEHPIVTEMGGTVLSRIGLSRDLVRRPGLFSAMSRALSGRSPPPAPKHAILRVVFHPIGNDEVRIAERLRQGDNPDEAPRMDAVIILLSAVVPRVNLLASVAAATAIVPGTGRIVLLAVDHALDLMAMTSTPVDHDHKDNRDLAAQGLSRLPEFAQLGDMSHLEQLKDPDRATAYFDSLRTLADRQSLDTMRARMSFMNDRGYDVRALPFSAFGIDYNNGTAAVFPGNSPNLPFLSSLFSAEAKLLWLKHKGTENTEETRGEFYKDAMRFWAPFNLRAILLGALLPRPELNDDLPPWEF